MATIGSLDPDTTFRRRVAIRPETPVVLSVPHAGIATTGFDGALASTLDVRGDADLFVDQLYEVGIDVVPHRTAGYRGPYVAANLSRFVCDMNRHPDDVSHAAVPQHPSPQNADGRGFVWAVTTSGAPALARPLTLDEWRTRREVHAAYHNAIALALERARARFGFAVLIDGHSMPSVGRMGHKDPGRPRADVVPGDRDGISCSPQLSRLVETHFRTHGYSVTFNDPYKGGFITASHGRRAENVHAIQVELRRDLYMNEATFTPATDGFARLQSTLRDLMAALELWRP